jgi:hypothetical protein
MSGEIVYAFPDDFGGSLASVMFTLGHGATSLPLGESLLSVSSSSGAIMFRLAFGHIKPLIGDIFGVPDTDYAACRLWLTANTHHIGSAWCQLEVLSFDRLSDQVRFEAAYASVLGHPAEALDPANWPHIFHRSL